MRMPLRNSTRSEEEWNSCSCPRSKGTQPKRPPFRGVRDLLKRVRVCFNHARLESQLSRSWICGHGFADMAGWRDPPGHHSINHFEAKSVEFPERYARDAHWERISGLARRFAAGVVNERVTVSSRTCRRPIVSSSIDADFRFVLPTVNLPTTMRPMASAPSAPSPNFSTAT